VSQSQIDISALIAEEPVILLEGATSESETTELPQAITPTVTAPEVNVEPTLAVASPTPAPTNTPAPTPTPMPLPNRVVIENMGVVKQSFNNCGPANLTQVLNWYGSDITQEDVAAYLKPNPEDRNVSPWQISDYVNEQLGTYKAITRSGGDLEMIKRFLAAGFPVVIEKGYELPDSGWWGHYLTVYGYDDDLEELYSQDSYLGPFDGSGRTTCIVTSFPSGSSSATRSTSSIARSRKKPSSLADGRRNVRRHQDVAEGRGQSRSGNQRATG
jgi:hypothetical protein